LFALIFEVFIESLEKISLDDGLIEFFFEANELLFDFIILSDKFFEFVFVDVEVVTTFKIGKLLFEFMIFLAQVLDFLIECLQIGGRTTLVGTFSVVRGLSICEKCLFGLDSV
jgi:hypothetical protein